MRRTRLMAVLTAAVLAVTTLLVPGTAQADETNRDFVELTAEIVDPRVKLGEQVTVKGLLQRESAGGLVPAPHVRVEVSVTYGAHVETVASGRTSADGTFQVQFAAETSGDVFVASERTDVVWQGYARPGSVEIDWDAPLTPVTFSSGTVAYGGTLWASGYLSNDPMDPDDPSTIHDAELVLEYSPTGETWSEVQRGKSGDRGYFKIETTRTTRDGYWRVRYPGADGEPLAISNIRHVFVKYGTRLDDFGAQAGSGGAVTIQGNLVRLKGAEEPADRLPVDIYFMAEGESTWEFQGRVQSGTDGSFKKQFTTHLDGYWTAAFWGDQEHVRSNAPIAYVDVPVEYGTEITEFGASPQTVAEGESITVAGLLTRSGGGDPEAAPDKPVYIYFLPSGEQEWQEMAVVRTGADGWFEKAFTAERDGYWTAWFFGDDQHLGFNATAKFVDVE